MAKRVQLVCQQLENISREALADYQHIIRQYIRGRNGVYALYKGEKLYYVGLATNLRTRYALLIDLDRHRGDPIIGDDTTSGHMGQTECEQGLFISVFVPLCLKRSAFLAMVNQRQPRSSLFDWSFNVLIRLGIQ